MRPAWSKCPTGRRPGDRQHGAAGASVRIGHDLRLWVELGPGPLGLERPLVLGTRVLRAGTLRLCLRGTPLCRQHVLPRTLGQLRRNIRSSSSSGTYVAPGQPAYVSPGPTVYQPAPAPRPAYVARQPSLQHHPPMWLLARPSISRLLRHVRPMARRVAPAPPAYVAPDQSSTSQHHRHVLPMVRRPMEPRPMEPRPMGAPAWRPARTGPPSGTSARARYGAPAYGAQPAPACHRPAPQPAPGYGGQPGYGAQPAPAYRPAPQPAQPTPLMVASLAMAPSQRRPATARHLSQLSCSRRRPATVLRLVPAGGQGAPAYRPAPSPSPGGSPGGGTHTGAPPPRGAGAPGYR